MIRLATINDAQQVSEIYNHYILHEIATLEEVVLSPEEMGKRMMDYLSRFPWTVFEENGHVVGYAYASQWKSRIGYKHTVESSVYLHKDFGGKGIGTALYKDLFSRLEKMDIHCIMAGIGQPNEASVALHEKFGFRQAALYKEIGKKFGRWIDVGYWQLLLK